VSASIRQPVTVPNVTFVVTARGNMSPWWRGVPLHIVTVVAMLILGKSRQSG
jgi:hypothetical protein